MLKEEVDLKEKDLFYQSLRAAFTVVIDNSEMDEFKRHSRVSSAFFFQGFYFFF